MWLPQRSKTLPLETLTTLTALRNVDKLKDEAEELILYDPQRPDRAVVFDAIPNAPNILPDGRFGPIANPRVGILIAPLLVLLLNVGFYSYHFGSSQGRYGKTLSELYQQALGYYTSGDNKNAKEAYLAFIELLEEKPPSSLYFTDHDMARHAFGFLRRRTKNREQKLSYLKSSIKHMGFIDQVEPIDTAWQKRMASSYYSTSQYALYQRFFAEAEQTARKAMELDPAVSLYIAHLPAALLFQGKYMEAQAIYLKWKDQLVAYPWRMKDEFLLGTLFLSDLQNIEGTKTNRMDVKRAKALLAHSND